MRDLKDACWLLLAWFVLIVLNVSNLLAQSNGKQLEL
jgi:hypothetical protein